MKAEELQHRLSEQRQNIQKHYRYNLSKTHRILHKRSQREVIKQICEELPDICIAVFPQALVVEAVAA